MSTFAVRPRLRQGGRIRGDASAAKTLDAFRHPVSRNLWLATAISNTGGMIQLVSSAWLMTLLTSLKDMVALVKAAFACS
jgi:hypothetical protein